MRRVDFKYVAFPLGGYFIAESLQQIVGISFGSQGGSITFALVLSCYLLLVDIDKHILSNIENKLKKKKEKRKDTTNICDGVAVMRNKE